jgi:RND family efflux transporter MFP subunit
VKVTVTAFPNRTFQGRITVITPALELQSRTAEIQISIPNPGYILNPGMFGRAEILLRSNPGALVIPIQAVVNEGDRDFVYLYKDGKAHRRIIRKGLVKDTLVEVLQGLNVGEQVITAGQGFLKDGMPVRLSGQSEKGS